MNLDVDYDHRLDSEGQDPDTHSPTLKLQHQLLWSKPLPDGTLFDLHPEPGKYLKHNSRLGEFFLSSDTISNSLPNQKRMQPVIEQIPPRDLDEFQTTGSVIGGRILFPGNRKDGQVTINSARGFNSKINDRFDLTLECIRLHYQGVANPLDRALIRYSDFFRLFKNFKGYVEFFLLQDIVSEHSSEVKFFLTHDPAFQGSPRPANVEEYMQYKANTTTFISARNQRIDDWFKSKHFQN